ncbi:MAG: hypothetical protein JOS17DRAFT_687576 [Linnemannia elongata]|nr:MAG: hypothetical protein JOS17DRAFT_687576 [Linnemannia elongata]
MTKNNKKSARYTAPAAAPAPRHNSSDSDNSDIEDRSHSRTSTSSVEEEQVKESNGNGVRPTSTKESTGSFLTRVSSIPLIYDSVSTLHSYAKDNKYGRYALDTAGSAVETVNKYTEPYQTRLQPHISKVDQLATKSLDIFENTFPIVTKPTAEIVTQITTVATSTANNITNAATSTATTIATTVNTHATPLVNGLETIVDRVLPAGVDSEKTPVGQSNQATRVVDLGRTVTRRVSRRVGVAVSPVTQTAQEYRASVEKSTVVVKSKDQIHALNTRLSALVESLRAHTKELQENVQKGSREASTRVQSRVSELSGKVLAEVDSLSAYLKEHSPSLPESVQIRIKPLVTFVNDRYAVVKTEISKPDVSAIQKARNILHLTTEETLPILQSAANDIRESLGQYQVKVQESVHQGYVKVQEVNSSVHLAAARAVHSARVILVGK